MKTIYNKYDKSQIGTLPRVVFPGRIITIQTESEADRAVDYLLHGNYAVGGRRILGFDTETKPSFKKGQHHKVALLQVSTHDTCFLFRLNWIDLCPSVKRLLEATTLTKIGLSWHDDVLSLHKRGSFSADGFTDLQDVMKDVGIMDKSLAKLYANIFGERISKREQLSNWESDVLSEKQKLYAATDAWACIMLYEEYERLTATKDYELIIVPDPQNIETTDERDNPETR